MDLIEGRPTGSVRISFGYMSTREDAKKLLSFIKKCFIDESLKPDLIMVMFVLHMLSGVYDWMSLYLILCSYATA